MKEKTQGKIALVTGASSGMGKVIAEKLIRDGLRVIAAARRIDQMADLEAKGAYAIAMDVSDEASVTSGMQDINDKFGGVDVLINNAGFGLYGAVEDIPLADARYQFEVNMFGAAHLIQKCLPYMRAKQAGTIINISSMGGKIYTPLGAWYHASKHALEGFSDCLRLELAPFNIHVVVVEPGIIQTGFGNVLIDPMIKYSGDGAYGPMVQTIARATEDSYRPGRGSPPRLIASVVSRAVKARRPKTRYVAGQMAGLLLFIRKWFGDRIYDRAVMSQVT